MVEVYEIRRATPDIRLKCDIKKIPTDLETLTEIYNQYQDSFRTYATEDPDRIDRIRVSIDIVKVAKEIGVEEDMVFGRLYYHFNKKYSCRDESGDKITFFTSLKFEGMSVNFSLVASVMADLEAENMKYKTAISLATGAISISVIVLTLSLFVRFLLQTPHQSSAVSIPSLDHCLNL